MTDQEPGARRSSWPRTQLAVIALWVVGLSASWWIARGRPSVHQAVVSEAPVGVVVPEPVVIEAPLVSAVANQERVDRHRSGRSPHRGPARAKVRWVRSVEGRVTATPVVDHEGHVLVGTQRGVLWSLTRDGSVRMRRPLQGRVEAAVVVTEQGDIYVGTTASRLYVLRVDGSTRAEIDTSGPVRVAPTRAANGRVYVAAGRALYAVDKDANVLWRFEADGTITSAPAIDDRGAAYFGAADDHLYAIDAGGAFRFRYRTGGDVASAPVLAEGGALYFGGDDRHVYALDARLALRWATTLDGYVRAGVAVGRDGSVLATCFGPRPALVILDGHTGETRSRFAFTLANGTDDGVFGGPVIDADGNIYVTADDGYLYALTADAKLRWAFALDAPSEGGPVLADDGVLYVVSHKGTVYALDDR